MADLSHSVADLPNMLHLRARTFAPLAAFCNKCLILLNNLFNVTSQVKCGWVDRLVIRRNDFLNLASHIMRAIGVGKSHPAPARPLQDFSEVDDYLLFRLMGCFKLLHGVIGKLVPFPRFHDFRSWLDSHPPG